MDNILLKITIRYKGLLYLLAFLMISSLTIDSTPVVHAAVLRGRQRARSGKFLLEAEEMDISSDSMGEEEGGQKSLNARDKDDEEEEKSIVNTTEDCESEDEDEEAEQRE